MTSFLTGIRLALGAVVVWAAVQFARHAARDTARHYRNRLNQLAHPQPVCLTRHEHRGRQLAAALSQHCPQASAADLAAACQAFRNITVIAARQHGPHAADVLACDLDGAARVLAGIDRAAREDADA